MAPVGSVDVTGPLSYEVREMPDGRAVLIWMYPNRSGGSCQFPSPGAARRYAHNVEHRRLQWTLRGRIRGTRRWESVVS